jgi:uncharacterized protein YuzE
VRTTYDPEVDAFYLYLGDGKIVESAEVRPGIVFDLDAEGRLVGIEVLDASTNLPKDMNLAAMERP